MPFFSMILGTGRKMTSEIIQFANRPAKSTVYESTVEIIQFTNQVIRTTHSRL